MVLVPSDLGVQMNAIVIELVGWHFSGSLPPRAGEGADFMRLWLPVCNRLTSHCRRSCSEYGSGWGRHSMKNISRSRVPEPGLDHSLRD